MPATLMTTRASVTVRHLTSAGGAPKRAAAAAMPKQAARAATAFGLALTLALGAPGHALAAQSAPADLAGKTITEYELLEPAIEEAATDGALTAALGQAEAKEVVAEAQGLEREVAALEIKMDESVGADTAALDKAAAPLAARVDQLSRLIALAGRGVNSN